MKVSDPHGLTSQGLQDDLLVLGKIYSLKELNYVDVVRQEKNKEMMKRWPILDELAKSEYR